MSAAALDNLLRRLHCLRLFFVIFLTCWIADSTLPLVVSVVLLRYARVVRELSCNVHKYRWDYFLGWFEGINELSALCTMVCYFVSLLFPNFYVCISHFSFLRIIWLYSDIFGFVFPWKLDIVCKHSESQMNSSWGPWKTRSLVPNKSSGALTIHPTVL